MDQRLKEAAHFVEQWQDILGLASWDITVTYGDPGEMTQRGALAEVAANWEREQAEIRLLPPALIDWQSEDVEYAIVHELLHLVFWHFMPPADQPLARELFEQSLNRVARAFVAYGQTVRALGKAMREEKRRKRSAAKV